MLTIWPEQFIDCAKKKPSTLRWKETALIVMENTPRNAKISRGDIRDSIPCHADADPVGARLPYPDCTATAVEWGIDYLAGNVFFIGEVFPI